MRWRDRRRLRLGINQENCLEEIWEYASGVRIKAGDYVSILKNRLKVM